jgi:hypothetical protein
MFVSAAMFISIDGLPLAALRESHGHPSTDGQSSTKPATPPPNPTVVQVMTDYSDLETAGSTRSSVYTAVAAVQSAHEKDGSYNDLAFREASVLWLTQQASSSSQASALCLDNSLPMSWAGRATCV